MPSLVCPIIFGRMALVLTFKMLYLVVWPGSQDDFDSWLNSNDSHSEGTRKEHKQCSGRILAEKMACQKLC